MASASFVYIVTLAHQLINNNVMCNADEQPYRNVDNTEIRCTTRYTQSQ